MKRNAVRTLITAICSMGMLLAAGCNQTGEMSVTGFYDSRTSRLAGDECDDLMLAAAEAEGAEQEELKDDYRACVEEAIAENGGHADCDDERDETCDIILEEIEDAIEKVRAERGNEMPDCDAPQSPGDEALCLLMTAYETCQLDHDGDGEPDVDEGDGGDDGDDENCSGCEDDDDDEGRGDDDGRDDDDDDEDDEDDHGDGGDKGDDCSDCDDGDGDRSEGDDDGHDDEDCPDCEGSDSDGGDDGDETETHDEGDGEDGGSDETDGGDEGDGGDDSCGNCTPSEEFCHELEKEIDACDDPDREAELRDLFERECVS